MKLIVALSYFHRVTGPLIWYSYPENLLDEDTSKEISQIMDQTPNEGFFIYSSDIVNSLNYYFEIPSAWARGHRELLMASIILDQQISHEIEENISYLCLEFSRRLQSNKEIFRGFYIQDLKNFDEKYKEGIRKHDSLIKEWVNEFYSAVLENLREKTEEEKIAILLKDVYNFEMLEKLAEGPFPLEWLRDWFIERFPEKNFEEIIEKLSKAQFIFVNELGLVEKYVLLLKEVKAERVPPDSVIEYIDGNPELIDLLVPKIQEFFNEYDEKSIEEQKEDVLTIFKIIADLEKYRIITELRNGLFLKDELSQHLHKESLESLNENVEFLKKHDVVEELNYNGEIYIVLKTDLHITTAFSEWLRELVPERDEL